MQKTLGQYVRRKRNELGVSQRFLAKKAGLGPTTISRIEADEVTPDSKTLEKLAHGLGVPMSALTGALQGRITRDGKHTLLDMIERLPPQGQLIVEKLVHVLLEVYER